MVSHGDTRIGRPLTPAESPASPGQIRRAVSAVRRYRAIALVRGLWVRRRFTHAGLVACPGGGPLPCIQNRGRLTAESVSLWSGVRLEIGRDGHLSIGKGTYLNRNVTVICDERVEIGRNCAVSWDVVIMDTDQHELAGASRTTAPVRIGDDVWIGCRSLVLKGVTIGRGSVIGAGAIVTRDVPPDSLAVGQPARVIRQLPPRVPGASRVPDQRPAD